MVSSIMVEMDIGKSCDLSVLAYERRLKTLQHWPFSTADGATCTAEKLAEVGFYCPSPESEPDSLCCFVCHKELDGWEPTDSPFDEHKTHSPKCKFLEAGCKDITEMKIKDYLEIVVKSQVEHSLNVRMKNILKAFDADMDLKKEQFLSYIKKLGLEIESGS